VNDVVLQVSNVSRHGHVCWSTENEETLQDHQKTTEESYSKIYMQDPLTLVPKHVSPTSKAGVQSSIPETSPEIHAM